MIRWKKWIAPAMLALTALGAGAVALAGNTPPVPAPAPASAPAPAPAPPAESKTAVINITTGPDDIFTVMTACHVAQDAINEGWHVILFFNGRGVTVPVKRLTDDIRLGNEQPLWRVLQDLVRNGAEVVVARESAHALGMVDADFIAPTQIRNWGGSIFSKIGSNTVVFTY